MPNDNGATTNTRGPAGRSKSSRKGSAAANPASKQLKPPDLSGKFQFIAPIVESQRIILQHTMVNHTKTMRKTMTDIRDRTANLSAFTGTYIDKHDLDEEGKGKEKVYVSPSFRNVMPLNHSTLVKKSSRCTSVYDEITTQMAEAVLDHENWKQKMSSHAEKLGKLETKARKLILKGQFCDAIMDIATGLVIVGGVVTDTPQPQNSEDEVAHAAIRVGLKAFPREVWEGLPFVPDSDEGVEQFYVALDAEYGTNFDATIKPKFQPPAISIEEAEAATEQGIEIPTPNHPDLHLVTWVGEQLTIIIPRLTTEFWAHERSIDAERKLDAKLNLLYQKKKVDDINDRLSEAMEIDGEGDAVVRSVVRDEVRRQTDQQITARHKEARKKSSGASATQQATPGKSGQSKKEKSKKKKSQKHKKPSKRRAEYSSDDDSYDTRSESRPRRRRRDDESESENDEDYYRRKLHDSVLRKGREVRFAPEERRSRSTSRSNTRPRDAGRGRGRGSRGGSRTGGRGRGRGRS
jgi:hypothetical protein